MHPYDMDDPVSSYCRQGHNSRTAS